MFVKLKDKPIYLNTDYIIMFGIQKLGGGEERKYAAIALDSTNAVHCLETFPSKTLAMRSIDRLVRILHSTEYAANAVIEHEWKLD